MRSHLEKGKGRSARGARREVEARGRGARWKWTLCVAALRLVVRSGKVWRTRRGALLAEVRRYSGMWQVSVVVQS